MKEEPDEGRMEGKRGEGNEKARRGEGGGEVEEQ